MELPVLLYMLLTLNIKRIVFSAFLKSVIIWIRYLKTCEVKDDQGRLLENTLLYTYSLIKAYYFPEEGMQELTSVRYILFNISIINFSKHHIY